MDETGSDDYTARKLHTLLLQLAKLQDDLAAAEAAVTPYWAPSPASVIGRRTAARVLREQAERIGATA